jgi:hypothetical protein
LSAGDATTSLDIDQILDCVEEQVESGQVRPLIIRVVERRVQDIREVIDGGSLLSIALTFPPISTNSTVEFLCPHIIHLGEQG